MENYKNLTTILKSHSELNSKIDRINKALGDMRKQRSDLESQILNEIETLKLQNKKLKIDNSHYFLGTNKQPPSINLGLIETVSMELFGKMHTDKLLNKIKDYREEHSKKTVVLKKKDLSRRTKSSKNVKKQSLKRKSK